MSKSVKFQRAEEQAQTYERYRLTRIQRRFVENYHRTGQAEQSAIDAGYAAGSAKVRATELLADSRIQLLLRDMAEGMVREPAELNEEYIIKKLLHFVEMNTFKGEDRTAMQALEMLNRYLQIFSDRKEAEKSFTDGLAEKLAEARKRLEDDLLSDLPEDWSGKIAKARQLIAEARAQRLTQTEDVGGAGEVDIEGAPAPEKVN